MAYEPQRPLQYRALISNSGTIKNGALLANSRGKYLVHATNLFRTHSEHNCSNFRLTFAFFSPRLMTPMLCSVGAAANLKSEVPSWP
jgi:hypothetical protein